MHSIDDKNTCKPQHKPLTTAVLTALGSMIGTAALVGIHHYYRKRHQPNASLQDYASGLCAQLQSLAFSPKRQVTRISYAYQQAFLAWQQAYHSPMDEVNGKRRAGDFEFITPHTTTLLTRPVFWVSGVAAMPKRMTTINDDASNENDFGVVAIDAERQIVWQTTMPERVHDIVVQPILKPKSTSTLNNSYSDQNRDVVVMGRRPSEKFWVLDSATGQVKYAIQAATHRHFYGHACYSLDGKSLYVTENDTLSLTGKIGLYNAYDYYKKIAEFDSYGIGPHELIMHPDGETLVIANGGIKTEQASREELNLDSMRPSLVYVNRHDGALLEQIIPEHNQMSVRHLAMHDDGTVMIGIQFQGDKHINVPLVLTHKRGDSDFKPLMMPNNQWQRFHQYIASVAVDSPRHLLCVTTPIGGCAAIFDLNTRRFIDDISLPDCAGVSVLFDKTVNKVDKHHEPLGFIVSDGQGQLTALYVNPELAIASDNRAVIREDKQSHKMSFDNHLQALLG